MTGVDLFLFILMTLGVAITIAAIQFAIHKKTCWWAILISFVIKFALVFLLALFAVAIDTILGWRLGKLTVALYLVLLGDAVVDLIALVYILVKKKALNVWLRSGLGVLLAMMVMTYAIIDMETINPKYHTYESDKLQHEYTAVFMADIHYGTAQSEKVVQKALDEIKEIKPDFILLGGDITDEFSTKEDMEWIYKHIGEIGVPTYFIYGNHDRQAKSDHLGKEPAYTQEELEYTIITNGIVILKDSFVQFSDDLVLMGREDITVETRKKTEDIPARPEGKFVLSVDHSPYNDEDTIAAKADLQLSGHSHAGQYFPLCVDTPFANHIYGYYKIGETDMYVSSGFAGWAAPARTSVFCNYEVFKLKPKA